MSRLRVGELACNDVRPPFRLGPTYTQYSVHVQERQLIGFHFDDHKRHWCSAGWRWLKTTQGTAKTRSQPAGKCQRRLPPALSVRPYSGSTCSENWASPNPTDAPMATSAPKGVLLSRVGIRCIGSRPSWAGPPQSSSVSAPTYRVRSYRPGFITRLKQRSHETRLRTVNQT
jgi:hypothetical protein